MYVIYVRKHLVPMMLIKNIIKSEIICHYTGKYRGAAHDICILRYKTPTEIPVVFHNGSTYDCHFIIKELAKKICWSI